MESSSYPRLRWANFYIYIYVCVCVCVCVCVLRHVIIPLDICTFDNLYPTVSFPAVNSIIFFWFDFFPVFLFFLTTLPLSTVFLSAHQQISIHERFRDTTNSSKEKKHAEQFPSSVSGGQIPPDLWVSLFSLLCKFGLHLSKSYLLRSLCINLRSSMMTCRKIISREFCYLLGIEALLKQSRFESSILEAKKRISKIGYLQPINIFLHCILCELDFSTCSILLAFYQTKLKFVNNEYEALSENQTPKQRSAGTR